MNNSCISHTVTSSRGRTSPPPLPSAQVDLADNSHSDGVSQEKKAELIVNALHMAPSMADSAYSHLMRLLEDPSPGDGGLYPYIQIVLQIEEATLQKKGWLALAKSPKFSSEDRLDMLKNIQTTKIQLQLLCKLAQGAMDLEPHVRLEAAHHIHKMLGLLEERHDTDPETLSLYLKKKNEAYCGIAMDSTLKAGDILLKALDRIGDYTLKKTALRSFINNKNLEGAFKQEALLAIAQDPTKEDYYRYWAAKGIFDEEKRDQALYAIAVSYSEDVSEYIILKAAEHIQNIDTKDHALRYLALHEELGSECGLDALALMQPTKKKESLCIQIALDDKFDRQYRLEAAKQIQDDSQKEETLIALIGWNTPVNTPLYSYDLQFTLAVCEAMPTEQHPSFRQKKYLNLRQHILQKFFSQSLDSDAPDAAGEAINPQTQCHWVMAFFEDILKRGYADATTQEQAILLKGFVHYLGAFCKHMPFEPTKALLQELYQASTEEDIKKDFVYTVLQCSSIQLSQHRFDIYTCALKMALPEEKASNELIQDLMDKVLSTEGCSRELCTAVLHHCKDILSIHPCMQEALLYSMIDNTHLDKAFRTQIVRECPLLDAEEKEKLLHTIATGQDIRRFKRMKIAHNNTE